MELESIGPIGVDVTDIDLSRPSAVRTERVCARPWAPMACSASENSASALTTTCASRRSSAPPPAVYPFRPALPDHPHVIRIVKNPEDLQL